MTGKKWSKLQQSVQFLKEVRVETRKVTFPDRKTTVMTTSAVIVFVIIVSIYLGIADFILSKLMGLALGS